MIELKDVSKIYANGTVALKDFNLEVDDGEFVFIVGASGAGKSTFLKLIMREEKPTTGEIIIGNTKLSRLKDKEVPFLRRKMGIVFQNFRLIEKMTVYENVAFAMHVTDASSKEIRERVPFILEVVGLLEKKDAYPSELSGGEQQRVGLARALVNNPEIIIADEPTGNVDPVMAEEIVALFSDINQKYGTTILMVTHAHELVQKFNKRIIEINCGTVTGDTKDMVFKSQDDIETKINTVNKTSEVDENINIKEIMGV